MSALGSPRAPVSLRGVTTNRLVGEDGAGVSLELPLDALVVVTGPSGSGKSSLVLDTLAAESRRRMLEALGSSRAGRPPRPAAALIANLPAVRAVVPDARGHSGAVVGAATELGAVLAALALTRGERRCPVLGTPLIGGGREPLVRALADRPEGEIVVFCAPRPAPADGGVPLLEELRANGVLRVHFGGALHRVDELSRLPSRGAIGLVLDRLRLRHDQLDRLREAAEQSLRAGGGQAYVLIGADLEELRFADRPYSAALGRPLEPLRAALLDPERGGRCADCAGAGCAACDESGLSEAIRSVAVDGTRLDQLWRGTVRVLAAWWRGRAPGPRDVVDGVMDTLIDVHLALDLAALPLLRPVEACAASERARLRIAAALAEDQPGGLLILDEPGARLDPPRATALLGLLRARVADGNGVLVVDHNEVIRAGADHEISFGPGAGQAGGRITHEGRPRPPERPPLPSPLSGAPSDWIELDAPGAGCLGPVRLRIPRGGWTVVRGANASGKSTLLQQILLPALKAGLARSAAGPVQPWLADDRRPPGGPRSVVATAIGVWAPIRAALAATAEARARGWAADRFSFNRPGGRCEACEGTGEERMELGAWAGPLAPCPACGGGRFAAELEAVRWRGLSAAGLLGVDVNAALELWSTHPKVSPALRALRHAGLGYLGLGQRTDTLSGGEAQRLAFAQALAAADREPRHGVLALDAPGAGLHERDAAALAWTLDALRGRGLTVVVADLGEAFAAPADLVLEVVDGQVRSA